MRFPQLSLTSEKKMQIALPKPASPKLTVPASQEYSLHLTGLARLPWSSEKFCFARTEQGTVPLRRYVIVFVCTCKPVARRGVGEEARSPAQAIHNFKLHARLLAGSPGKGIKRIDLFNPAGVVTVSSEQGCNPRGGGRL